MTSSHRVCVSVSLSAAARLKIQAWKNAEPEAGAPFVKNGERLRPKAEATRLPRKVTLSSHA